MKKLFVLAAMCGLMFVGLTSMVNMDPPPNTTCNDQCAVLVADGIFSGQGACMSACNTCLNPGQGAGVVAACNCHIIKDTQGLENAGFKNFGECVQFIKSLL